MLIIIVNGVYSMDDILTYLESITQPDSLGPEHSRLMQKAIALEVPVHEALSLDYLDKLTEAQTDILRFECRECFSRGFRLGVQLILAAMD